MKSQYPTERANVEERQKQLEAAWQRCRAQAAERRARLESAVGHQVFANGARQLQDWIQVRHRNSWKQPSGETALLANENSMMFFGPSSRIPINFNFLASFKHCNKQVHNNK